MRLHRFIGQFNLTNDIVEISDVDLVNQIKNVFRFSAGDQIILCDGASNEATAEIVSIDKKKVEARIIERSVNKNKPKNETVLYCAMLKKENFELVVQKAVECGISEIVPVITERTVKLNLNEDRLAKIAREAAEQSGRGTVPKIKKPIKLEEAIKDTAKNSLNLFFDETGEDKVISILESNKQPRINAWVGPEGGWSEKEIELANQAGFKAVSLGKLTLRGETAAIVAAYFVANL